MSRDFVRKTNQEDLLDFVEQLVLQRVTKNVGEAKEVVASYLNPYQTARSRTVIKTHIDPLLDVICHRALKKASQHLEEVKKVVNLSKKLEPFIQAITNTQKHYKFIQILRWAGINLHNPQSEDYKHATSRIMCIYECRHTIFGFYYLDGSRGGLLVNFSNLYITHQTKVPDCSLEYDELTRKRQALKSKLYVTLLLPLPQVLIDMIYEYGLPLFDINVWSLNHLVTTDEKQKELIMKPQEQKIEEQNADQDDSSSSCIIS